MSAHYLPDTPALRVQMAEASNEALAAMGLDATTVGPWEDGYRAAASADSTFEWWYFDMQLHDGSTVVVTFNNKDQTHPDGPVSPSVLLIHHAPDGTRTRKVLPFPAAQFTAATDACDVAMGANTVKGDLTTYVLHVEDPDAGFSADLTLTRVAPSWRPGASITYFDHAKTEYLAWVVPVPYGTVTGSITDASGTRQVTGAGYHDHNWGNKVMSSMLDHWYWGRAHVDDFTLVYVCMTTKGLFGVGQINLTTLLVAKGDQVLTGDGLPLRLETSGDVPGPGGQHYPTDLKWSWHTDDGTVRMHITNPELIEALDMKADGHSWRHPVSHLLDHPMYYDFNADIALEVDLKGVSAQVTGRTLFEKMMFR